MSSFFVRQKLRLSLVYFPSYIVTERFEDSAIKRFEDSAIKQHYINNTTDSSIGYPLLNALTKLLRNNKLCYKNDPRQKTLICPNKIFANA